MNDRIVSRRTVLRGAGAGATLAGLTSVAAPAQARSRRHGNCDRSRDDDLVGAYYFSGWWSTPQPTHYLVNGVDWRPQYPEREPFIGWFSDSQGQVDKEIRAAATALDYFVFDYYTNTQPSKLPPGAVENNNNGLKFYRSSGFKQLMDYAVMYVNAGSFRLTTTADWETFCDRWVELFCEPEYLKIDGKPVFFVYNLANLRNTWGSAGVGTVLDVLRAKAVAAGLPGVLCGGGMAPPPITVPNLTQAATEGWDFVFSYTGWGPVPNPTGENEYSVMVRELFPAQWDTLSQASLPVALPLAQGRDRSPLHKPGIFVDGSPELFRELLQAGKDFLDAHPAMSLPGGKNLYTIYAWNELAEGGILTPTVQHGHSYLAQVRHTFGAPSHRGWRPGR